jgi:Meiotically up-regulated gene 113
MATREHILAEIRRTAIANDGKALGANRFLTETGIGESDWRGKFWARWGDALTDAGFSPNEWQSALVDDDLFRPLAALVKELGRFPVASEIELRRRADPNFPSRKIFRRFGGKADLVARLSAFCIAQGEPDVAALCVVSATESRKPDEANAGANTGDDGFVYMIKHGKHYKIGKTFSVPRRHREIALELPEKPDIVHTIRTDDPTGIEAYWHNRFASKRANGEWFELSREDIQAFKKRKFM